MALEVWLPLQGSLENNGQDSLTVENHGGIDLYGAGEKGDGYYFDGQNHYFQFSKALTNVEIYKGDFSWAVWLNPFAAHRGAIITEHDASGTFSHVCLEITAALKMRFYWNGSPDITFTTAISQNTWTHVAVTKTGNTLTLYLNGVQSQVVTQTLDNTKIYNSAACIRIGNDYRSSTTTNSYNGGISDVRIYSNCLTPAEVASIYDEASQHIIMLNQSIPSVENIKARDRLNLPYTGTSKEIILPPGVYLLECWGAQGGKCGTNWIGGKGGYSNGKITIYENTTFYLYAGGAGAPVTAYNLVSGGGFNGGGSAYSSSNGSYRVGGGGGGTDIRIGSDSLMARLIVAGGGGGGNVNKGGGDGGGIFGKDGDSSSLAYSSGKGATQLAGGASSTGASSATVSGDGEFGQGASAVQVSNMTRQVSGGGGGWYGGGAADHASGGGGSGYVYNSNTAYAYPSGCSLNNNYYLNASSTTNGTETFTDYSGIPVTGHEGDGAVRITALQVYTIINIPTLTDKAYNGSLQTPGETGYDSNMMTKIGTQSATLPGTYTITYVLKEGYMWSDKTLERKSIQWSITSQFKKLQSKIYNSSFNNYTPQFFDGTDFTKYDVWIYGA